MPEIIEMPKLGMTMEEGLITEWHKKEGEKVEEGETLLEIMTDKTNMEIESPVSGILYKILAKEGEEKKVGEPIAIIKLPGEKEEDIEISTQKEVISEKGSEKIEEKEKKPPMEEVDADGIPATPYAKYIAKKKGIDLEELYQEKKRIITGEMVLSSGPKGLSPIQKAMAQRMGESARIPQFTLYYKFDMENVLLLNEKLKDKGYNSTITTIFLKLMAYAMEKYPLFNSTFNGEEVIFSSSKNIGIAVQTEKGLLVPVMKDIDNLDMEKLIDEYKKLIERAKNGVLTLSDTQGATITLSNLGMFGVSFFKALLIPGQMAILAFGAIEDNIKIEEKGILIRKIANISITCDHRVIDGAYAARFMQYLKELTEKSPEELVR